MLTISMCSVAGNKRCVSSRPSYETRDLKLMVHLYHPRSIACEKFMSSSELPSPKPLLGFFVELVLELCRASLN